MFNGWLVAGAVFGAWLGTVSFEWLENRRLVKLAKLVVWFGLICAIYCVVTGLYLAVDWVDPLADASSAEIASHTHARGSGLVILLIRIWPYFLIVAGAFVAYANVKMLRRLYRAV